MQTPTESRTIRFINPSCLWAEVLVACLFRLGLRQAFVCPGSRSSPLAFALAAHPGIGSIPVLDERSAGFLALGAARATRLPVALVCTSGTAAANFLPAIVEASESGVPLLVLTADRPPELRDISAGQTIDQIRLFGVYPRWNYELPAPQNDPALLVAVRQAAIHAWERATGTHPGPVHLNLPFRDPLIPEPDPSTAAIGAEFNEAAFLSGIAVPGTPVQSDPVGESSLAADLASTLRGVIISGPHDPREPDTWCASALRLSDVLGWPILADALSPLRHRARVCASYDHFLRDPSAARALAPDCILILDTIPVSKPLRQWMASCGARVRLVSSSPRAVNPTGNVVHCLRSTVPALARALQGIRRPDPAWAAIWERVDRATSRARDSALSEAGWCEPAIARAVAQSCPPGSILFVGNSMPPRDLETFLPASDTRVRPLCNRGASGIDGLVSTALGASLGGSPVTGLIGDLSFLHDSNALLSAHEFAGPVTLVVLNNNGGGIFGMLPVSAHEPPFERFFATPQRANIAALCAAHGVAHREVASLLELSQAVATPEPGIRVIEARTDRRADAAVRRRIAAAASAAASAALANG
jgi:2-succinyl-5-enolpyruvyl-6-hydroxy-3-cyclohexene-1-carboxylate synthase